MSNLKNRFLALGIVVIMLVAALCSTVSAATSYADVTDAEDNKKIKMLSAIGIVKGTGDDADGNPIFTPERDVTRQEMALFLARINSANPGAFQSDNTVKLTFTDVKDPTYFLAIKHCVEQGIIDGRVAGEIFDPLATVTLDEALKMIICALGYKDLSYPIETTKKAKELGFALEYKDTAGKTPLTRIEVIRLLYHYFYSDEQSLEIVKNEVTGVQHTVRVPHPVMEKFGINVYDSYIVRANDYTAEIGVELETPYGDKLALPKMAVPTLTAREIADGKDIILAYNNFKVVTTSLSDSGSEADGWVRRNGYTYSGKWTYVAVARAEIGLTKDNFARDIVGLKTVYYRDSLAGTRPEPLDVISYVKGTRTKVDLADTTNKTEAKVNTDFNNFTDYATGLTILGKTYDLRANVQELKDSDIYGFSDKAVLSPAVTTDNSKLKQLGGFIGKGGNFGLEYVVNDTDAEGKPTEFYFIFTPYNVGYHNGIQTGDDWGNQPIRLDGYFVKDNTSYNTIGLLTKHVDTSKNIIVNDINKVGFAEGNAYLFTVEGQNLNVFAKLVKRVDKKYPEYIYSNAIGLAGINISLTDKNNKIAINATTGPNVSKYYGGTKTLSLGTQVSAFSSKADSDIFYIFNHDNAPSMSDDKKYGVLTQAPTTIANYLSTGKLMYMYSVWTYANSRVEQLVSEVWLVDDNYYTVPQAGDLVSYQKLGDYYRVGAFDNINYLYFDWNGYRNLNEDGGSFTYGGGSSYNPNYLNYYGVYKDNLTGIINSNTQILAAEFTGVMGGGTYVRSRSLTLAQFNEYMNEQYDADDANLVMITSNNSGTSSALAVLLQVPQYSFDSYYDTNSYFTITNVYDGSYGYGNSSYNLIKGYNYINGQTRDLAVDNGYNYVVGQVVKLAYERYTTFGTTTYQIAERINVTPAKVATDSTLTSRGAYTQPSALLAYLKTLTANQLGNLDAEYLIDASGNAKTGANVYNKTSGVGGYFMYPLYRLSSGIAYSWPYDVNGTAAVTGGKWIANDNLVLYARTAVKAGSPDIVFYSRTALTQNDTGTDELGAATAFNRANLTGYKWKTNILGEAIASVRVVDVAKNAEITNTTYFEKKYITLLDAAAEPVRVWIEDSTGLANPFTKGINSIDSDYYITADQGAVSGDLFADAITRLTGNNINIITVTLNPNANPDISLVIDRSNGDFLGYFTNKTLDGGVRTTATTQWFMVANNAGNVDFTGFPTSQAQTSDIVTFVRIIDNR